MGWQNYMLSPHKDPDKPVLSYSNYMAAIGFPLENHQGGPPEMSKEAVIAKSLEVEELHRRGFAERARQRREAEAAQPRTEA